MLAINAWDEDKGVLKRMVRKQSLTHTILVNGSEVFSEYGCLGTPTQLWIDRTGVITATEVGFGGAKALERRTIQLINAGARE